MTGKFKFNFAKLSAKTLISLFSSGISNGGNYPGYIFTRIAGQDAISDLASEMDLGSVLVTGTNGKTTTTTLLIKLMENDIPIKKSFENNTINSITTALLKHKGDLGVFEYGIRNIKYGIPDTVQRLLNPIGVVYTTISQEHTQVAGVKNPFTEYLRAKQLLSYGMKDGVIVSNADDPRTAWIGSEKQNDVHVNFYGIEISQISDFDKAEVVCPNCGEILDYSQYYLNHRGVYSCSCGFKRPEPNVKLVDAEFKPDSWKLVIKGEVYNYHAAKNIELDLELNVPAFGFHNIYNTLASITAYSSFTPKVENIEKTIHSVFDNLDMSFIPPGRFEVIRVGDKNVGIGQGDNGDALKINALFMKSYLDSPLEFIYTTPDVDEEDIFNDHFNVIKSMNPEHIIVLPGRHSVEKGEEYYNIIKKEFESAEFYPIGYDELDKRIKKLSDLVVESQYKNIMMSGCGEEQAMWERIKKNFINR